MGVGVHHLELDRGAHPQGAVAALAVVEDLQVFEDRVGKLHSGVPSLTVQQLDLHPGPERFDDGIIETQQDRGQTSSHERYVAGIGDFIFWIRLKRLPMP